MTDAEPATPDDSSGGPASDLKSGSAAVSADAVSGVERPSIVPSLAIAAGVAVADQLTKHWALNRLSGGRIIEVLGPLQFELTFNRGMAFSRGSGMGPVIGVLALVVVTVLLVGMRRAGSRLSLIATGMVIGGAVGNIIDRLFRGEAWLRGAVVDFINPQFWPVFNVADVGVTVGGTLIVLASILDGRRARPAAS